MTLQVLVATMHQKDHSLLERMNIQCDAIVINQCDRDEIERFQFRGHDILWMSLKERGVGLSRNTALMRATADILLFADDDVVYNDGWCEQGGNIYGFPATVTYLKPFIDTKYTINMSPNNAGSGWPIAYVRVKNTNGFTSDGSGNHNVERDITASWQASGYIN